MLKIVEKKKYFFLVSGVIILFGIVSLLMFGLNFGIDFKGGTLWELKFSEPVENQPLREFLEGFELGEVRIRDAQESKMIKFRDLKEGEHDLLFEKVREEFGEVEELSYETVGPVIGGEIKEKAIISLIIASVCIVLYIAWAFRHVSRPVSSWQFGLTAIITLLHDLIVMLAVFIILGKFFDIEINTFFITAMLAVLGYSVNDTIVVFDRVRERLKNQADQGFESLVNKSINETIIRSLNTSITTLLVLLTIFLFGGASIRWFIFALIIGVLAGTYSSIFIASPLLTVWYRIQRRRA